MAEVPGNTFSTQPLPLRQKVALRVEYDGSSYCGWQSQPQLSHVTTVQSTVESALSTVGNTSIRVHCAGRTDTGVHALAQWIHFEAPVERSLKAWVVGGNSQLPSSVRIADARVVADDFHARHSAVARRYDYLIANTPTAPALLAQRVLWVREPLNVAAMHQSLQSLLGECDFSAFRAAKCQSRSPMRFMESASVTECASYVQIQVVANAFLHHMVRNIVGSVLQVGLGVESQDWLAVLLAGRDRTRAAATAPPYGLYLSDVRYDPLFDLPAAIDPPFFLSSKRD